MPLRRKVLKAPPPPPPVKVKSKPRKKNREALPVAPSLESTVGASVAQAELAQIQRRTAELARMTSRADSLLRPLRSPLDRRGALDEVLEEVKRYLGYVEPTPSGSFRSEAVDHAFFSAYLQMADHLLLAVADLIDRELRPDRAFLYTTPVLAQNDFLFVSLVGRTDGVIARTNDMRLLRYSNLGATPRARHGRRDSPIADNIAEMLGLYLGDHAAMNTPRPR